MTRTNSTADCPDEPPSEGRGKATHDFEDALRGRAASRRQMGARGLAAPICIVCSWIIPAIPYSRQYWDANRAAKLATELQSHCERRAITRNGQVPVGFLASLPCRLDGCSLPSGGATPHVARSEDPAPEHL